MTNDICDTCQYARQCVNGTYCTLLRLYTLHAHLKTCGKYKYQPPKHIQQ